ncbi:MAG: adenylate/guanylate cyclase domain-containing protein [Candidatus Binatia bacterium]
MTTPETRYAKSGAVHIAYQVVGDGPRDLVLVPGWVSHLEYEWEEPLFARFLRRLASFSRLILLDRRGTGLSDRVSALPSLEQRMDDVRAVMDAAGSKRAAILGISEGGPMAMMFAATHPERVSALVLCATFVRLTQAADYPIGVPTEIFELFIQRMRESWGQGATVDGFAPSLAGDPHFRETWARMERVAVSPAGFEALMRVLSETDARGILPVIRVPTLILHRAGDLVVRVGQARFLAERIAGAKYVELPGNDHFPWVGDDAMADEVEEFLTGTRHAVESDRVLATVLFSDIVASTEHAAKIGDRRWREVLESYLSLVRRQLSQFRGREVDTTGDGMLASFDGPARAIRCACAIRAGVSQLGIEVRAGLHTGECAIIGDKVGGIAVHIGARVAAAAKPNEVLVSATVKDLVAGSGIVFDARGVHALKGVPGEWPLYAVSSDASP